MASVGMLGLWAFMALLGGSTLSSCSDFNRALKSDSVEYKMEVAEKYYNKKSYDRAIPLLEELLLIKRGTAESERVGYLQSKSYFLMKDYTLGAYYLSNFTKTFPTSQYAEECAFLNAICYYRNSPIYELDQGDTRTAIDELQLFMLRYPETTLRDSCNSLIDQLRLKLEVKAYHNAEQYFHMRNYQAASIAFAEFMRVYPNSDFREDAMLRILQSDHLLAIDSIESKKVDRLRAALRSYRNFADAYPQSVDKDVAERIQKELANALDEATQKQ
ncbi:MAG TPA: outer membrane protein assembly factor BamD [Flavobacteriales bacterium]|nr:outer membrane protein assembly factor BamD [Flavobacteriales bacterium]